MQAQGKQEAREARANERRESLELIKRYRSCWSINYFHLITVENINVDSRIDSHAMRGLLFSRTINNGTKLPTGREITPAESSFLPRSTEGIPPLGSSMSTPRPKKLKHVGVGISVGVVAA